MKKTLHNKKGFTLAELLIVVAIIAVLVAIAIPIFTSQLEKSRDAVTVSNMRAAYAQAAAAKLTGNDANDTTVIVNANGTVSVSGVIAKGEQEGFAGSIDAELPFTHTGCADMGGTKGTYTMTFTWAADNTVSATATK